MNETARPAAGSSPRPGMSWRRDFGLWAVVVAGGGGTRFGGPKQFENLAGRQVIEWAVESLGCADRVVVVVPEPDLATTVLAGVTMVAGGPTRSASVRAGLEALPDSADRVLIHDAARPLATPAVVGRVVAALQHAEGAIPVVPVTDTLRSTKGSPVDRSRYVAVQTPQGFWVESIKRAHAGQDDATDDATLVTNCGGHVVHVDGAPSNMKITVPDDLVVAEALLAARLAVEEPS